MIKNGNGVSTPARSEALAWAAVVVSLGMAFWSVANPKGDVATVKEDLHREVSRLDAEILRVKRYSSDKTLTKDEHVEFVRRTDKGIDTLRDEINRIRADQVTRSEHQQHWSETSARIDGVRDINLALRKETFDAIANLQKETGGQYTIGDQLKNLQDQLKLLTSRLDSMRLRQAPITAQ